MGHENDEVVMELPTAWLLHGRIQDFFEGGLKDEFTRMFTDCIAVKTQMLR